MFYPPQAIRLGVLMYFESVEKNHLPKENSVNNEIGSTPHPLMAKETNGFDRLIDSSLRERPNWGTAGAKPP